MAFSSLHQQILQQNNASEKFSVYARQPDHGTATHAVVLLPAIAGVNEYIAGRAEQLGRAGYLVAVIDYFSRAQAKPDLSTPERINAAVADIDDRRVLTDISHTLNWLGELGIDRAHIGILGLCIGGSFAVLAASSADSPACAITYYGQLRNLHPSPSKPRDPIDVAAELKVPLLGHFGDMDRLISTQDIANFSTQLRSTQRHHEIYTYSGAPHAFDEWFRPAIFRPIASSEAWNRSLAFLDWHLRARR
ncbi:MAG: hypothetical protein EPN76_01850 [Burkholderiaceae bacterium]|nr:MAG: hypothetical protein EPN76_01850 [Burkholderiaceae bacterium]TAM04585.1 MAG: hypothetical protein EPN67_07805 [Pusillimonas sp.]